MVFFKNLKIKKSQLEIAYPLSTTRKENRCDCLIGKVFKHKKKNHKKLLFGSSIEKNVSIKIPPGEKSAFFNVTEKSEHFTAIKMLVILKKKK